MNYLQVRNIYSILCEYYEGNHILINGLNAKKRYKIIKAIVKIINMIDSIYILIRLSKYILSLSMQEY